MTVSGWTPVSRAVFRVPIPSATWAKTAAAVSAGSRVSNSGVPLRSENQARQVEHRSRRRAWSGPYRLGSVALATTGRMPNALNDLVVNAHVTKGYKLGVMTAAPFREPKLMESAARLEAEAVRSQTAQ